MWCANSPRRSRRRRPRRRLRAQRGNRSRTLRSASLEVDLSRLDLQPGAAESISSLLGDLSAEQQGDRLQRLERSLLRLERIGLETLSALQRLVNAIRKASDEDSR